MYVVSVKDLYNVTMKANCKRLQTSLNKKNSAKRIVFNQVQIKA